MARTSLSRAFAYEVSGVGNAQLPYAPVTACVRFVLRDATTFQAIFSRYDWPEGSWHIVYNELTPNKLACVFNYSGIYYYIDDPTTAALGVEHMVVLTWAGATAGRTAWFNGRKVTAPVLNINSAVYQTNTAPIRIGARSLGNYGANADVSDARLWNRVLTDSEVKSLFADPWALYRTARPTLRGAAAAAAASRAYYYRNFVASRAY